MDIFYKLHNNNGGIISEQIDQYLMSLDFKEGNTVGHGDSRIGLQRWYCGDLYDTHVCVYRDKIYFYKDLNCGGYEGDAVVDVPNVALEDLNRFVSFLKQTYDRHSYLFDDNLTK